MWRRFRRDNSEPDDILAFYAIEDPPVPVFELAADMGVKVFRSHENHGWDSALFSERDPPGIYLRPGLSLTACRFGVAYELATLLIDELGVHEHPPLDRETFTYNTQLLVPGHMVQVAGLRYGFKVESLARRFQVTEPIMSYRLKRLAIL